MIIVTNFPSKANRYTRDRNITNYMSVDTQKWENFATMRAFLDNPAPLPSYVVIPESVSPWNIAQISFETAYSDLFWWIELCGEVTGVHYDHYYVEQYFNDICTISFNRGALYYEDRNGKWIHVPTLLEPLFLLEKGEWILKSIE